MKKKKPMKDDTPSVILADLHRLRQFPVADVHAVCRDFKSCISVINGPIFDTKVKNLCRNEKMLADYEKQNVRAASMGFSKDIGTAWPREKSGNIDSPFSNRLRLYLHAKTCLYGKMFAIICSIEAKEKMFAIHFLPARCSWFPRFCLDKQTPIDLTFFCFTKI